MLSLLWVVIVAAVLVEHRGRKQVSSFLVMLKARFVFVLSSGSMSGGMGVIADLHLPTHTCTHVYTCLYVFVHLVMYTVNVMSPPGLAQGPS